MHVCTQLASLGQANILTQLDFAYQKHISNENHAVFLAY